MNCLKDKENQTFLQYIKASLLGCLLIIFFYLPHMTRNMAIFRSVQKTPWMLKQWNSADI